MKTLTEPVLLSLLILIAGCSDKDIIKGIDVSGYVFEYGTLDPIEGARVYLVTGSSGNWGTTDTLVTGPDGRYAFRHPEREPGTLVALYVFADDYYDIIEADVPLPWKKQEIDIVMDPYAWLKLHVINTNPESFLDIIRIRGNWEIPYGNNIWAGGVLDDIVGDQVDITIILRTLGNRDIPMLWRVIKAEDIIYRDTIFAIAHDTTFIEFQY